MGRMEKVENEKWVVWEMGKGGIWEDGKNGKWEE